MIPHYALLIHGIGEEKQGFNRGLKKNIQQRSIHALEELKKSVPSLSHGRFTAASVVVREIVWPDLTQNDQDRLWAVLERRLRRGHDRPKNSAGVGARQLSQVRTRAQTAL